VAVSRTVISAYLRLYTPEQLETALAAALADRASGVLVTNISFAEGGGSGQAIQGDPNEIIEILELCLQRLDNPDAPDHQPLASRVNFSRRRFET
jgi:hypothetical protein